TANFRYLGASSHSFLRLDPPLPLPWSGAPGGRAPSLHVSPREVSPGSGVEVEPFPPQCATANGVASFPTAAPLRDRGTPVRPRQTVVYRRDRASGPGVFIGLSATWRRPRNSSDTSPSGSAGRDGDFGRFDGLFFGDMLIHGPVARPISVA
ncbi:hypothetical protein BaRGS_00030472, partial [Batillaria attramentaria]